MAMPGLGKQTPEKEGDMAIPKEVLDQLIAGYKKPEDLIGENGLLKQLTKALVERAMQAEMTDHLGYPRKKQKKAKRKQKGDVHDK